MIIITIPIMPYMFGIWLYLSIPKIVTAVMVKPPYVAYVNPTGIIIIAFARKNIHRSMVTMHIIVGPMLVKPFVVLRNPLEVIPRITAKSKYTYPIKLLILFINFVYFYLISFNQFIILISHTNNVNHFLYHLICCTLLFSSKCMWSCTISTAISNWYSYIN